MTYNELCEEIKALGFETETDSPERMLFAVQRALRVIATERPIYKRIAIHRHRITQTNETAKLMHKGGFDDEISFRARAYSFRTYGEGAFLINDESGERRVEFSGEGKLHKGFLYGEGIIKFVGEYSYDVLDIGIYDELFCGNIEDIPEVGAEVIIDVRSYEKNFLAFVSTPKDERGKPIKGASVRGAVLTLPSDYSGRAYVIIKLSPAVSGEPDEIIEMPECCEHLLPLLSAAYVWLEDNPEIAEYYMSLYREAMSAVKYYDRPQIDTGYEISDRWA